MALFKKTPAPTKVSPVAAFGYIVGVSVVTTYVVRAIDATARTVTNSINSAVTNVKKKREESLAAAKEDANIKATAKQAAEDTPNIDPEVAEEILRQAQQEKAANG